MKVHIETIVGQMRHCQQWYLKGNPFRIFDQQQAKKFTIEPSDKDPLRKGQPPNRGQNGQSQHVITEKFHCELSSQD